MAADKRHFDIVVIVPLEEEWHTINAVFGFIEDLSDDSSTCHVVESGHPDITMLIALQDDMGKDAAYHATYYMTSKFDISLLVCLGIAGSLHNDMKIGDVCYTGTVLDVYNNTKLADLSKASAKGYKINFSPVLYPTPKPLIRAVTRVRIGDDLKPRYALWQTERSKKISSVKLDDGTLLVDHHKELLITHTKEAIIVCAGVSDSKVYNAALKELDRRVSAIETEAGGVFSVAQKADLMALEIRGICDYAENKGALEKSSQGLIRQFAAENAATFLRFQIQNSDFRRVVKTRSLSRTKADATDPTSLAQMIGEVADSVYERIKDLSQEYRVQPKGYRLPLPRIRQISLGMGAPDDSLNPIEIRDSVGVKRFTSIQVPRTYPDASLPFVIADDLFNLDSLNKQCLPIVIDADNLVPPKGTLRKHWPEGSNNFEDGALQIIYILHNLPFNSFTRMKFIKEQISDDTDSKFVILFKDEVATLRRADMTRIIGSELFGLCPTSFLEITHFVQKNFEMTGSEAEVIALRLRETFDKYGLAAHPTYFAGLPRPALASLLQANRRAELIQIAVDGYLSYVVLQDTADIKITRTTRLRFLGLLASEIHVGRRAFSKLELIQYADQLSIEHDWGIDASVFINAFVERGILEIMDDVVSFTLPFVEAYALARALVDDEIKALCFFDGIGTEMEATVLDLYSELKPSSHVIDDISQKVKRECQHLAYQGEHILMGDSVRPALLQKPERLESLRKRVRNATEDVLTNKTASADKQRLLDIVERAKEKIGSTPDVGSDIHEGTKALEIKLRELDPALQAWNAGTILLGSGAEHLKAETKQELIADLIDLGCKLAHTATQAVSELDFTRFKADILSDLRKSFKDTEILSADTSLEEQVNGVVDLMEYMSLLTPITAIMHRLCENARMRMVGTSLNKVKPNDDIRSILHAAWLSDIDVEIGQPVFLKSIKGAKIPAFLRTTLVSHILNRVHWSHAEPSSRLKLLKIADSLLEPVSGTWNKDSIVRMLDREKREAASHVGHKPH